MPPPIDSGLSAVESLQNRTLYDSIITIVQTWRWFTVERECESKGFPGMIRSTRLRFLHTIGPQRVSHMMLTRGPASLGDLGARLS